MTYTRSICIGMGVIGVTYIVIEWMDLRKQIFQKTHALSLDLIKTLTENPKTAEQIKILIDKITTDPEFEDRLSKLLKQAVINCSQDKEVIDKLKKMTQTIISDTNVKTEGSKSIKYILNDIFIPKMG